MKTIEDFANLLQYFKYSEQLAGQKAKIPKLKIELNVIGRAEGRECRVKPEIEKMQTLLEEYEEIVDQMLDLLTTEAAQKSPSRISSQELRREIELCLKLWLV